MIATRMVDPRARDVADVLAATERFWTEVQGQRLFVTGGTGFFGTWFLETLVEANRELGTRASALVLTRDIERFRRAAPHVAADPAIRFHIGDVARFEFPDGEFSHVLHMGSTAAEATFRGEPPLAKFDTIVGGTRRVVEFARRCRAAKVLYTSSGAVYGPQPASLAHVPEEYTGAPATTDPRHALGHCKRAAEFLVAAGGEAHGYVATIARCFSFIGPHLQLDLHYAAGNFLRQAARGETIEVTGDGSAWRSYLYAADLVIWLLTIVSDGVGGRAYNVGSEEAVTIVDLARRVARHVDPAVAVRVAGAAKDGAAVNRYIPSTARARHELGLRQRVGLDEAIARTLTFLRHPNDDRYR
jgi:nucleoside-diphosphate-sugar epimerase